MKLSKEHKLLIADAIKVDLKRRNSNQAQHSRLLNINQAAYSRVISGDVEKVLSELEWIRIGKKLHIDLNEMPWRTANTEVFDFVTQQLEAVQEGSLSALNCDMVGIGKTHAAEYYAATHANVIYIKCRESITRAHLIRLMAQELGLESRDTIESVREKIYLELLKIDNPLIILDDAGYMNDKCWMEVKSLNDDVLYACGFYVIGDTSLRKKIEKYLFNDKIGWNALFDRFNQKYQSYTEKYDNETEVCAMKRAQLEQILHVNLPGYDKALANKLINNCKLSIRVLRKEINKIQMQLKKPILNAA